MSRLLRNMITMGALSAPLAPHSRIWIPVDTGIIFQTDFTAMTPGAGTGQLPAQFNFSRTLNNSSTSETVRTGLNTVLSSGLIANVPRIGQYGADSTTRGLVIEHSETNNSFACYDITTTNASLIYTHGGAGTTPTSAANQAAGPDGLVQADRQNATGQLGKVVYAGNSALKMSLWARAVSGTTPFSGGVGGTNAAGFSNAALDTNWTYFEAVKSGTTSGGNTYLLSQDVADVPGMLNSPQTVLLALACSNGQATASTIYKFLCEATLNAANGTSNVGITRNGERLWLTNIATIVDKGRIGLYYQMRPKGGSSDYSSNPMRLWTKDSTNYCEVSSSTGKITVSIGGATWTSTTGMTWTAKDKLEIWVEAGGGTLNSHAAYRVNGGAWVDLGSSAAPQASITTGVTCDILCFNSTGNPIDQFTCWLQKIAAYKSGVRPSGVP